MFILKNNFTNINTYIWCLKVLWLTLKNFAALVKVVNIFIRFFFSKSNTLRLTLLDLEKIFV